jgi:hypothetical protein
LAERESAELPFEYSFGVGFRTDNLTWSIAGRGVNIASEVSWKKTAIAQLRAAGKINLGRDWVLRGAYTTGAVRSGANQDSDYAGNDRTQEYSRSDNKTGGAVRDLSVGAGRKLWLFDTLYVAPIAGLSIHQQSMTMYDGTQTIPANGAFNGLNSSYDTQWKGGWLGADALLELPGNISMNATAEYHWADYSAEGNWNLRSDLAHPVSFRHVANGYGKLFSAGASYRLSRNFMMSASFEKQKWSTYPGYDETHLSSGATNYYTLNPITWDSKTFSLAAIYQF